MAPVIHDRDDWLEGYQVAPDEERAWWGGSTFPPSGDINNITWHYPGQDPGVVIDLTSPAAVMAQLRQMQSEYHRRKDGDKTGRPFPFDHGYDPGYNAAIDPRGEVWRIRWTDKRCAANGEGNSVSFAIQFMVARVEDDLTPEQVASARFMDGHVRGLFPNIPPGRAGHKGHRNWVSTTCPGDVIFDRHVATGDLLAGETPPQGDDDDMRYKFFKAEGFADVIAVGPGNPFNPGSPQAAQELVDKGQVARADGSPVAPGTPFGSVVVMVSQPLLEQIAGPLTTVR